MVLFQTMNHLSDTTNLVIQASISTFFLRAREFTDQYKITHEFIKALHKRYKKEGIEIPFPQTDVHLNTNK